LTWFCEIYPAKSLNGAGSRIQKGPLQKISTFSIFLALKWHLLLLVPFKGPK
jgi:hypothetical protein